MSIRFIVKEKSAAGKRSITNGVPNQDNITVYEDEYVIVASVNDGATNCENPVAAAEYNGQAAVRAAKNRNIWSMPEKKFKQFLNNTFNEIFSNSDFSYRQLCATTGFVMINKSTKAYRAFSVGDTAILKYNKQGQFRTLLQPMNAFRKSATYFTNDSFSVKKFSQFRQGTITDDIAGFVIFSDGAESIALPPYTDIKRLASSVYVSDDVHKKEQEKLFKSLHESTDDDISIAVLAVSDDDISSNMNELYRSLSPSQPEEDAKTEETPVKRPVQMSENPEITEFLTVARSPEEIFRSDLIEQDKIVTVLTSLVRKNIVSCTPDGKFYTV